MKSVLVGVWSPFHGQTCNTSNAVAIATRMAVTRAVKILLMHNTINKSNMENAFFDDIANYEKDATSIFEESGIDAMMKLAKTSQLCPSNFSDYTNILIRERLEMLFGTFRKDLASQELMTEQIQYIIKCARDTYKFVFLDINAGHGDLSVKTLELADVLIISLNQNMEVLKSYFERKEWHPVLDNKPHILLLGNYDENSMYNIERIRKKFNFNGDIYPIYRNVNFADAFNHHKVIELLSTPNKKDDFGLFLTGLDTIIKKLMELSDLDDISLYDPLEQKTFFDRMFGIFR